MGKKDHMKDLDVDGMIKLKCIFKKLYYGMDWTHLAQDTDKWRVLVKAVMNIWVLQNVGNFLTS
jgi:hypothetical protein